MADKSFLDWPFFEPRHKELALAMDEWDRRQAAYAAFFLGRALGQQAGPVGEGGGR